MSQWEAGRRAAGCVDRERLLRIAERLIAAPSPTGTAAPALDALGSLLEEEGFDVERPEGGHPRAPAVVARLDGTGPGRVLQFDGHLDTVHLPFVPPRVDGGELRGSGAADMKGGMAAAVEAMLAVRDAGGLASGSILLVAHDLHEAPWGYGEQLEALIAQGIRGNAVLIPEPLCAHLPVAGRGQACWEVTIERDGPPVHEVMRPEGQPDVIAAGAKLVERLMRLDAELAQQTDPEAGRSSVFVGLIHAGEIYNQFPQACRLEGTRRWVPGIGPAEVENEFRGIIDNLARATGTRIRLRYQRVRDAFRLDLGDPIVDDFQSAMEQVNGSRLRPGPKPFVDDGNCFAAWGIAAITHGPRAGGQHTLEEWASIDDLERVARVYAATAVRYGARSRDPRR
ncbi:MAG: acetylornithine deacetylase [Isosphaeraceae bacterium]|jgi:acetylornithine deacetylase/succinyl-diaminopimelate desuccinylase-like protein|nr:MAG: acetylornithine deacetylase [Isosphaeraceae bacterium]